MDIKTTDLIQYCMHCGNPLSAGSYTCACCGGDNTANADPDATVGFCRKCLASIPLIASYCPYCGSRVERNLEKWPSFEDDSQKPSQDILPISWEAQMCSRLKKIRAEVARANHIPFETTECPSIRECQGICPACDQEGIWLNEHLLEIEGRGEEIVWPRLDLFVRYDRAVDQMIADQASAIREDVPLAGMPMRRDYLIHENERNKKKGLLSKVKGFFRKS